MVDYKCNKCNKKFAYKNDYTRHINRKYTCEKTQANIDLQLAEVSHKLADHNQKLAENNKMIHICLYCNKKYSHKSSLSRHINYRCSKKKVVIKKKN